MCLALLAAAPAESWRSAMGAATHAAAHEATRAAAHAAPAEPALGVRGDRFTVDGRPAFLTFVSYFDALDASDRELREDFGYFRDHGLDGVRIFPNWWDCADMNSCRKPSPRTLMDAQGALRPASLERLRHLLALAAEHRLAVDLSFTRDTVKDDGRELSAEGYAVGLRAVTRALAGRAPHVLFDLQNEVEIHGFGATRDIAGNLARLRASLRAIDPGRLVTASTGSVDLIRQLAAQAETGGDGAEARSPLDVMAYHDPRVRDWWSRTAQEVAALKAIAPRPIYFQEPIAYQLAHARPGRDDVTSDHFVAARRAAREAGAAAWLFHTRKAFRLDDRSFVAQQEPGERAFFTALARERDGGRTP